MNLKTWSRVGIPALLAASALALPVLAQTATPAPDAAAAAAAAPVINKGDTAWMLVSAILVLAMSVPGLALFYGGLVRSKNMLSVLMQVFYSVAIVGIIWVLYGYSLAFTGGNDFFGGFSKAFLKGVTVESAGGTFSVGVAIPELVFVAFQMTFAMITPALIFGAFAERVKFSAVVLFVPLWVTFIYFPMAHMVWYWAGPDAVDAAAKALAAADAGGKAAAQAALDAVLSDAGFLYKMGAIDFAGGTVVHINAGIAALVGCLIVGKRTGYGKEAFQPHSLTLTLVGAGLLWVGWFGFNAGSNLEANGLTALAMMNTFIATCAAALSWMIVEWLAKGKPSMLGVVSGAIAGLVAVTPMAGFAGIMGALISGLVVGVVCFFFCTTVKNAFGYDDSLDVFGVHGVGGIVGAIATGIVVSPALGGTGIYDYTTGAVAEYNMATQVIAQIKAVLFTIVWSGVGSAIVFYIVHAVVGLRATVEKEREGLDITEHGERAYHS
ncbi:ammonium transporter [Azorhizobium oxalatiphilum]|uniref:Ammonium transporter n=1 Tax=Azorhizobium oxalatiphilum TaxID=980631 RepID=A0A917CK98_9HYPH|nr:ammonium transporter [Azorhizobium oxalatiphilum]GGF89079.1 ammonium transporter [Azorhizobium oxalatiphilum]